MQAKIEKTKELIQQGLQEYKNPVVFSSFGKDSIVLLHLIRQFSDIPVVFHKEPFFPRKYEFANKLIQDWDLTVYDFPPFQCAVQSTFLDDETEEIEIVNYHDCSLNPELIRFYVIPTGIITPQSSDSPFLCALNDILLKPKGRFSFPWDCCFVGHKSSDTDVFYDSIELNTYIQENDNAPDWIFPLKDWTDEDLWKYTNENNLPWNKYRYYRGEADRPKSMEGVKIFRGQYRDMTYNPDYFETCFNCISKRNPDMVKCPKTGKMVRNVSEKCNYIEPHKFEYFGGQK